MPARNETLRWALLGAHCRPSFSQAKNSPARIQTRRLALDYRHLSDNQAMK